MTVTLLGHIHRYQVELDADLDTLTESLPGSVAYSFESQSWFVWDGDSWESYTYPLLDAASPNLPTADEKAALDGANAADSGNVYATMDDLPDITVLTEIPTIDPEDGVTIWNDSGVLKLASAP